MIEENKRWNILLVDDDEDNHFVVEALTNHLPLNYFRANSGREALDLVFERPYIAMVLDVMMPGMDGLSVATMLRSHDDFKTFPIIFATAISHSDPMVKEIKQINDITLLFKPLKKKIICQTIESLFNSK